MPIASWQKFGVPEQLHVILNCVYFFQSKYHRLPRALNEDDSKELHKIVKDYLGSKMQIEGEDFKVEKVDEKLIGRQPSSECSLPFLGFNQSLKSRPWYKSTSQLDTISSLVNMDLLRNKFNFMNITASNFIQASTQTTNKSKYTVIGTAISDRKRLLVWQDEQ